MHFMDNEDKTNLFKIFQARMVLPAMKSKDFYPKLEKEKLRLMQKRKTIVKDCCKK